PRSGLPPGALRACRRVRAQPPHLGDKAPNEGCLLRGVLRERIELWMSQLQEVAEFLLAQRLEFVRTSRMLHDPHAMLDQAPLIVADPASARLPCGQSTAGGFIPTVTDLAEGMAI